MFTGITIFSSLESPKALIPCFFRTPIIVNFLLKVFICFPIGSTPSPKRLSRNTDPIIAIGTPFVDSCSLKKRPASNSNFSIS